jgi:hypothetical protein
MIANIFCCPMNLTRDKNLVLAFIFLETKQNDKFCWCTYEPVGLVCLLYTELYVLNYLQITNVFISLLGCKLLDMCS